MLDEAVPFGEDFDTKSIKSEQPKEDKLEIEDMVEEAEVKSENPTAGVLEILNEDESASEEKKEEEEEKEEEEK